MGFVSRKFRTEDTISVRVCSTATLSVSHYRVRTFLFLLVTALLVTATAAVFPSQVSAHDQLAGTAGSVNEDGSGTEIVLSFTGNIKTIGLETLVVDAQGNDISAQPAEISGRDLTVYTKMPQLGETVTISWRVVSEDDHPIQARTAFAVIESNAVKTIEFREPEAVEQVNSSTAGTNNDNDAWSSLLLWGVIGLAAIIVALAVFFGVLRRNRIRAAGHVLHEVKGETHV